MQVTIVPEVAAKLKELLTEDEDAVFRIRETKVDGGQLPDRKSVV